MCILTFQTQDDYSYAYVLYDALCYVSFLLSKLYAH